MIQAKFAYPDKTPQVLELVVPPKKVAKFAVLPALMLARTLFPVAIPPINDALSRIVEHEQAGNENQQL